MEVNEEKFPAQWALDLMEPTPLDHSKFFPKYYLVYAGIAAGGCTMPCLNMVRSRPLLTSSPYIFFGALFGGMLSYVIHRVAEVRFARRDAMMRDYIMRHPEHFPEPENRKYADIFMPWVPIR